MFVLNRLCAGAGPARAVRDHERASSSASLQGCMPGLSAVYLAGLVVGNRPTRAQHCGGVSRCRHLACADRDVRDARPAGVRSACSRASGSGARDRGHPHVRCPPGCGVRLPAPFRFQWREKAFISWSACAERSAFSWRRSCCRPSALRLPLFRHRVRRGADLAAGPGLDDPAARRLHPPPRHDPLPRRRAPICRQLEQETWAIRCPSTAPI